MQRRGTQPLRGSDPKIEVWTRDGTSGSASLEATTTRWRSATRSTAPPCWPTCAAWSGRDEAEDVLQRTFLDLWRHADRYDQGQSFSGWLFTIAHRRAVDHLRSRRPAVIPVEVLREMMGDDGRETAERFAWAADVRAALTQLPQEQRETIELAYFGDRTQREISRELAVPLGTVKARMARGTRALGGLLRAHASSTSGTATERSGQ